MKMMLDIICASVFLDMLCFRVYENELYLMYLHTLDKVFIQYSIFQESYEWALIFTNKHSIWRAVMKRLLNLTSYLNFRILHKEQTLSMYLKNFSK